MSAAEQICRHGHVGELKYRGTTGARWCAACERQRYNTYKHNRRKEPYGARTIDVDKISRSAAEELFGTEPAGEYWRPSTRGDCANVPRPCPFVSCKWHLYTDISRVGNVTLNFPHLQVHEMGESCALDVVDRGDATLEEVSAALNVSRERVRQIEEQVLRKISAMAAQLEES